MFLIAKIYFHIFYFQILSLAVVGIGIYILWKFDFDTAAYVLLGLGIITSLCAIYGILGAGRESSCLLKSVRTSILFS